jgi:DNA-binding transcriptional ArsR family regulator
MDPEDLDRAIRALANPKRRQVLQWLRDPVAHFPPQVDGDLVSDGVCSDFIADKLGVGAPTASEHLRVLRDASLVEATKIKRWVFYRRNEPEISQTLALLADTIGASTAQKVR